MNILITGASFGIGRHLAGRLSGQKNKVWGLARTAGPLEALKKESNGYFQYFSCDVSSLEPLKKVRRILSPDSLHAIICCAAVQGAIGDTIGTDPEKWAKTVQTNLVGTYYTIHTFFDLLKTSGRRAKVICFSGGGAASPRTHFSAYGVSKAGVVRLVETLSEEWKTRPIDINAVAPGATNTRLMEEVVSLGPDIVGEKEYRRALKQKEDPGSMEDISGLIDFLLSEASDGISGKFISAKWDPWKKFDAHKEEIMGSDILTLRRIVPKERGFEWK